MPQKVANFDWEGLIKGTFLTVRQQQNLEECRNVYKVKFIENKTTKAGFAKNEYRKIGCGTFTQRLPSLRITNR